MNRIKTVIVDDELHNRDLVKFWIDKLNSNFEVVGEAANVSDAYSVILSQQPKVVFLDIKMPGGDGFQLLKKIPNHDFDVVFITGFDEYALKAFECLAFDYILKPINPLKFKQTLARIENKFFHDVPLESVKRILTELTQKDDKIVITKIPIHVNRQVVLLNVSEIVTIQSEEGCTAFFTINNDKFYTTKQIGSYEFVLNESNPRFIQINRGIFINLDFIVSYTKSEPCIVKMQNGEEYQISRRRKTDILNMLHYKKV